MKAKKYAAAPSIRLSLAVWLSLVSAIPAAALGQASGTLRGTVTMRDNGTPLHNTIVTIVQLKRSVETDEKGNYEFTQVPPGSYSVLAHMEGFPDAVEGAQVSAGGTTSLDIQLKLSGIREEITVTATGSEQSTFEALQTVTTLDSARLVEEGHPSLGEVLDKEPGVAKRSFGPGSARPVIRGFDGDRVLVLQDGARLGSLGSQSADHGEPVDVLSLERLEVVKGPATLLYGSNAIGGVVNAVTGHDYAHEGVRGYFTAIGGTTNDQGGVSGGLEYGTRNWMIWGNGSGQRAGDYDTPIGEIPNSETRTGTGLVGFGHYSDKTFFSMSYGYDNRRYGVPFASLFEGDEGEPEEIDVAMRRHEARFNGGFRDLGRAIDAFRLTLSYSDYRHRELEGETVGTVFNNKEFNYRGVFEEQRAGRFDGSFGFSGLVRSYEAVGAETLAPPVDQNVFAVFTLQGVEFERFKLQFGGRVEHTGYNPTGLAERSFTGFSGAAGIRVPLWESGAAVANYTHSYRAPALEELYNFGPHLGNLTFEIGNPGLDRERSDGIDLSLRHSSARVRAEANLFYYRIKDFVFLAPTGNIEENLIEARYVQSDSRFVGTEINFNAGLHRYVWLNLGLDSVDAQLTDSRAGLPRGTPLPRIPPLRGRIGFDFQYNGLSVRPEAVISKDQDQLFPTETRTGGYTVFNVAASYSIPRQHFAHLFSVNAFNLGDRLYRNHLSFIKELAPEIGRGVRFSYTVRFF
ncbi:MAG TPA: TonB-dependent receptor [Blastocatellia bacterium]|nr:TonB-dependent receptor [Blastocatellia bacterium]